MAASVFTIELLGFPDALDVVTLSGREALSRCYRFDLDVDVPPALELSSLLGTTGRLVLRVGGHERIVAGEIARARRGTVLASARQRIRVRLVPFLARLELRRKSRIFQDASSREIATRIMTEHGVAWRAALLDDPPVREYCVQHEETDLAFVERLFAEDGIVYRFEPPAFDAPVDAPDRVVLFDAASKYPTMAADPTLVYRAHAGHDEAMRREEHHIASFVAKERVAPNRVELRAFDFQRPQRVLSASSPEVGAAERVAVEAHGPYGETQVEPQPVAMVLDQVRRATQTYTGESSCARLMPGTTFTLAEHDDPDLSAEYAAVSIRHEGRALQHGPPTYQNRFTTVPKSFLLRPARVERRVRQSLETAIVTGPPGEEVFTDNLGRIQVRFHWDGASSDGGATSCWIRVAQAWAGAGWGAQFIPRVGMEVLVAFLGGDPDRPVVVGCLPNATHPPAFPLPANKTKSGWKSRSTPEHPLAGSNEISFDDAAGAERIDLIAKRDFDVAVTGDMHTTVSGKHVLTTSSHDVIVTGSQRTKVSGLGSCSYGAGGALDVAGDLLESISGARLMDIGQDVEEKIAGSRRSAVEGDRKDKVAGPWTLEAESQYVVVVGTHETPGHAEVQVRGSSIHTTDGEAVVEAKEKLTLVCGKSRIELTPDGIRLEGGSVSIGGKTVVVAGDGPSLRLTERAEILAEELKIYGKESSLELDRDATLKGAKVYLNCGRPPPAPKEDSGEPVLQALKLRLTDPMFQPYAQKRYELRAGDHRAEGTTDADGALSVDVPKSARVAHVDLWTEVYPTGPRKTYTVIIRELPPVDTLPGLRARLKNLGYFHGAEDGEELDEATVSALRQVQTDHHLQVTGQPDPETRAVVLERHGH